MTKNKKDEIQINPGDTLLLKLPSGQPGKEVCCSVRVLKDKPFNENNFIGQILDCASTIYPETIQYVPGKIMEIAKNTIISVSSSRLNDIESTITIEILNGCVSSITRSDGEIDEINVRVIDSDSQSDQVFSVGPVSAKLLCKNIEDEEDLQMFLIDESTETET
jgi:hypothetical protein